MNKLKVFTAFSGYDSQCMALDKAGIDYELVGWSEIDPVAIQAHNAVYPQWQDRNFGDISKIDWDKVPEFDFFTYSSPCFVAGTKVLTKDGLKNIEDVKVGDLVLTHTNTYKKVTEVMKHAHNGDMVIIKSMSSHSTTCTGNHPFYARLKKRVGHKQVRVFEDPTWVNARDLTKDHYLGLAVNTESLMPEWNGVEDNRWGHHKVCNKLPLNSPYFWYLMGRYIGDGWKKISKSGNGIIICCSERNETSLLAAIKGLGWKYTKVKEKTVTKVTICSNELCAFVERYGHKAIGKKIDGETLNLPASLLAYFLRGYIESDGYVYVGKGLPVYKISTISEELAYGLIQVVMKVLHTPAKLYYTKRKPKTIIEGREVNQHNAYEVVWKEERARQDKAFYEDGYVWIPIKELSTGLAIGIDVYNLEVEGDHSYTANGLVVHNCTDFSNAGLQKGGEEGSGTRSSLLWECRRAIVAKKPKYLFFENVKALVSKKFMPLFLKWVNELESYGYQNFWKVLNAKDYGIPQNRERIFMISILSDARVDYKFPDPFPLENCLADLLEENVSEEFYLSEKSVEGFKFHNENHEKKGTGFI